MAVVEAKKQGYNYKYADLATLIRYVEDELHLHVRFEGTWMKPLNQWGQGTILVGDDWQPVSSLLCPMPVIPVEKKGMDRQQSFFAAVTTAKRYSLMGALGIASTEDEEQLSVTLKRDAQTVERGSELKEKVDSILSEYDVPTGGESQFISQILQRPVKYGSLTEHQAQEFITRYETRKAKQQTVSKEGDMK